MTVIWCMIPEIWCAVDKSFCHFGLFFDFLLPNNLKNHNFEKMKKSPRDTIILHRCNINDNHIIYDSWNTAHHWQDFLSFWTISCPFTPPNNPKNQNFEKKNKKTLDVCHKSTTWCIVPEIWSMTNRIFCHFGLFFALLPP